MKNYIELDQVPNKTSFMFVDTDNELSYALFERKNLKVKSLGNMTHPEIQYLVCFVEIYNKDIELFKESMEELDRGIQVIRGLDYESVKKEIFIPVINSINE